MEEQDIQADVLISRTSKIRPFGETTTSYSKNVRSVEECLRYGLSLYTAFNSTYDFDRLDPSNKTEGYVSCVDSEGNLKGSAAIEFSYNGNLSLIDTTEKSRTRLSPENLEMK